MKTKYCPYCKTDKPISDFSKDKNRKDGLKYECILCARERKRIWHTKNRDAENKKNKEHTKKFKEKYGQSRARILRLEVLSAYGGKCVCCGESNEQFLALDHVNGGGSRHIKGRGGSQVHYRDAKRKGYPADYRVLCHNCNFSLGRYGFCPHQNKTQNEIISGAWNK